MVAQGLVNLVCDGERRGCLLWPGGKLETHIEGCPMWGKDNEHRPNRPGASASAARVIGRTPDYLRDRPDQQRPEDIERQRTAVVTYYRERFPYIGQYRYPAPDTVEFFDGERWQQMEPVSVTAGAGLTLSPTPPEIADSRDVDPPPSESRVRIEHGLSLMDVTVPTEALAWDDSAVVEMPMLDYEGMGPTWPEALRPQMSEETAARVRRVLDRVFARPWYVQDYQGALVLLRAFEAHKTVQRTRITADHMAMIGGHKNSAFHITRLLNEMLPALPWRKMLPEDNAGRDPVKARFTW